MNLLPSKILNYQPKVESVDLSLFYKDNFNAESEGFEPSVRLLELHFSKVLPSTVLSHDSIDRIITNKTLKL